MSASTADPLVFDCHASFGPRPGRDPLERWTLAHLLEDLDRAGIAGALVRHTQAWFHDPMAGNRRLCAEIAPHRDRLWPCWMAHPDTAGDFPAPGELRALLREHGVRALQLAPIRHGYAVNARFLRPLAAMAADEALPVFVPFAELGEDYDRTVRFCEILDGCDVVLTDVGWPRARLLAGLLAACPRLRLEFSFFQLNRGVEWVAGHFGIERCLLGTGLPQRSAGAARGFLDWSLLAEGDRAAFAGGNLAALLGAGPDRAAIPPPADDCGQAAREGRPLPYAIRDAHCHVLGEGERSMGREIVAPRGDAAGVVELARRCGISRTVMMSWQGPVGCDADAGNATMRKVARAYGGEVAGLVSVDPLHQSEAAIRESLRQCVLEDGFVGIKPYAPTSGFAYHEPAYAPAWEFAEARGLLVLLHTDTTEAAMEGVVDLAGRYPRVSWVLAHSGGSWAYARRVAAACRRAETIYAELTYTPVHNGIVEWLCAQAGPDRVLFGSDAPMRDPRPQLGWVVHAALDEETKRCVLGGTLRRILENSEH